MRDVWGSVDGTEYAFSTWFAEAKEIDLASIILGAENKDETIQEIFLQCLYRNYSEEEINETIKLAVNKGYKNWLEKVEYQVELRKFKAGMTKG
ncbi:hypothetical protein F8M41_016418 [Gigaspora margarita]|uniref:Uncharacterized protein n=1 Tax=Gigaspora margarita TaxID=4874 RepID=A0A8H4EMX5_GIGMA|nr:hypothetical protein F8M41_016418 [Gigaspora margarita]